MKIEKVNDNQIRCTLTREDLAERQIKLSELYLSLTSARKLANRPLSLAFRTSPFLAFHSCGVQDMPVEMAALLPSTVMRQSMLAVPSAFTFCLLM